ncbi:metallophosphoesterase [Ramlibacter alkalitolerans]|uniref:Metallophosphoesterase n=1 Tax=Ramlibacter alkalitolerans TaxID=2039631 RepID=A0ABS1JJ56_9BURK|nr:metallophosphoesterase [Ramlibacter alkalitolerans]MBL0424131.1 metallophosphoesterase [Ramlibacter alkalitolerans]
MNPPSPPLCIDHYAANTAGRDLIVGDVHGAFSRLRKALDRIAFDERVDRLFCVGDLVDRGPESAEAFEWLKQPWLHSILGNHERAALDWARGDLDAQTYAWNGGAWNIDVPPPVREHRAAVFAQLPVAIEIETPAGLVGLVHADVPSASWAEFRQQLRRETCRPPHQRMALEAAVNSRRRFRRDIGGCVSGVHAVVVGHTTLGRPRWSGNILCIETGGWSDGYFTIVDAATLAVPREGDGGARRRCAAELNILKPQLQRC